jgi:hypothetical protein
VKHDDDWEGYVNQRRDWTVPEGTRFDVVGSIAGVECAFGGPDLPGVSYRWGAPFRRLRNTKTARLSYAKYHAAVSTPPPSQESSA